MRFSFPRYITSATSAILVVTLLLSFSNCSAALESPIKDPVRLFKATSYKLAARTDSPSCNDILEAKDECMAAKYCRDSSDSLFNYFEYVYCSKKTKTVRIFSMFLELLFLFAWLGVTASDYFSPNLKTIAQIFRLPDSIAGATLLAIGNSAPDLFTTYSAFKNDIVSMAFGQLIGGVILIVCVVSSIIIIICKEISVPKQLLFCEMVFLSIGLIFTTIAAFTDQITFPLAISRILVYILFVLFIMIELLISKRFSLFSKRKTISTPKYSGSFAESLNINTDSGKDQNHSASSNQLKASFTDEKKEQTASIDLKALETNLETKSSHSPFVAESPNLSPEISNSTSSEAYTNDSKLFISNQHYSSPGENSLHTEPILSENLESNINLDYFLNAQIANSSQFIVCKSASNSVKKTGDSIKATSDHEDQSEIPNIVISSPSIKSKPGEFSGKPTRIQSQDSSPETGVLPPLQLPFLSPSNSRSNSVPLNHNDSLYWAIVTKFIPILNRWKPTTSWYLKPLLIVISPPVLLLTVTIPVLHALPKSFSQRQRSRRESDYVWDVLSYVSQSITHPNSITDSPAVAFTSQGVNNKRNGSPEIQKSSISKQNPVHQTLERNSMSERGYPLSGPIPADNSRETTSKELIVDKKHKAFINRLTQKSFSEKNFYNSGNFDGAEFGPADKKKESLSTSPIRLNNNTHINDKDSDSPVISPVLLKHSSLPAFHIRGHHGLQLQSEATQNINRHQTLTDSPIFPNPSLNSSHYSQKSSENTHAFEKRAELLVSLSRCILTPVFISYSFSSVSNLGYLTVIIGLCVGVIAFLFFLFANKINLTINESETNFSKPLKSFLVRFRPMIDSFPGFIGFVAGILWINQISNEIVAILNALGSILNISNSLMGFTLLAFGNSIGDFATNITVARLGFPIMGLSACFGGPILNISLGIGVSSVVKILNERSNNSLGLAPIKIYVKNNSLPLFYKVSRSSDGTDTC
ncbi:hypothetical protein BB560_000413 [Smittium megazygosporum]|uniref:Sodium/calcium exchanger membrane region domain-containing protein n=1 Tax=Smittium megazygosporum TaxID=133381 RepID=A0A2T9ZKD1_9FUNG|nr:hypothetical protein BB560_000413 [Smittium megazygosporum]